MRYLVCLILILSLALLSLACPSTSPTTTAPGTTTPAPTTASPSATVASPSPTAASPSPTAATTNPSPGASTPASPSAAGQTFGQLANAGANVFTNNCALCHGNNGQGGTGPAIIGSGANLQKYNTAQGLYDFIHTNMPANAPGSLPTDQYQQVTGYLLVQNNFVSADTAFNANQLSTIQLKK